MNLYNLNCKLIEYKKTNYAECRHLFIALLNYSIVSQLDKTTKKSKIKSYDSILLFFNNIFYKL